MRRIIIHTIILYIFLLNICYLQECPPSDTLNVVSSQNSWDIPYNNNWNGLEIMTWNLRDFPISGNTIDDVQEIISDMLPDIIGFQELSLSAFNFLLASASVKLPALICFNASFLSITYP